MLCQKVHWHAASAHDPPSYSALLEDKTAVVHTLGILLEGGKYKSAMQSGNALGLLSSFAGSLGLGDTGNPLAKGANANAREGEYERMNRDSGVYMSLTVLEKTMH